MNAKRLLPGIIVVGIAAATVSYEAQWDTRQCGRMSTSSFVSWSTELNGTITELPDGRFIVSITAKNPTGPPTQYTSNCVGTIMRISNHWPGIGATFTGDAFDERKDYPLGPSQTGTKYTVTHIERKHKNRFASQPVWREFLDAFGV